ncbi:MAG: hypothetical protein ACOY6K_16365 [Pseudomonadota bacterium]
MSSSREFFTPIVRLVAHQTAAAVCFTAVVFVSLIPLVCLKVIRKLNDWAGLFIAQTELTDFIHLFSMVEKGVLWVDVGLYCVTFLFSTIIFVVEEFEALRAKWRIDP